MDITSPATVLVLVLLLNIASSLYTDTPTPDVNPFPEIWNKIFCEFLKDANNPIKYQRNLIISTFSNYKNCISVCKKWLEDLSVPQYLHC